MVTLYVGGKAVSWAEAEAAFAAAGLAGRLELRDAAGNVVAPGDAAADVDPDWVKAITPEETARRMAEPGFTFEEMKQRLSWQ